MFQPSSTLQTANWPLRLAHLEWVRRGIGRSIMQACEQAILDAGFHGMDIVATLAGEPLYASFGYTVVERYNIPLTGAPDLSVVRMNKCLNTMPRPRVVAEKSSLGISGGSQ